MAVQQTTSQRQPSKLDYSSQIQFRFEILYLPLVEYFIQSSTLCQHVCLFIYLSTTLFG